MKIVKKADIEETRLAIIAKINTQAEQAASQFLTPTNLAQHMYRIKQQEMRQFMRFGSEQDTPLLLEEAKLRDMPLPKLVQEIEKRQNECDEALKAIELVRQQALIAAKQAKTVAELHKAADVVWPQVEEIREIKAAIEPVFDFISHSNK